MQDRCAFPDVHSLVGLSPAGLVCSLKQTAVGPGKACMSLTFDKSRPLQAVLGRSGARKSTCSVQVLCGLCAHIRGALADEQRVVRMLVPCCWAHVAFADAPGVVRRCVSHIQHPSNRPWLAQTQVCTTVGVA
ncbi:unnamed protein product [Ostreobium quekettii]|uniref:Uncharacterized protein n=1 Tax=Ostreobium quekettii TaxID=121088 RepID=A0A8S1J3A6_9CHLO|nr:unnamed protein product [Ostreobium quekettii]